mmetsp:Transcript_31516/g.89460  ORF Transcript_31516/g.89460 Transcript_31516/m.89460 type:complete len:313 (+) Transcript_31516:636-1574(+)
MGAAGRLFVGGGLSGYFDEEPRKWRMTGELVSTVGVAMEIATTLYPKSFLLLAGVGTLAKSVGKGMGRPAFRVIQQHFAKGNNVGDVAAKEEVWEVTGQMLGIAVTIAVLKLLEDQESVDAFLATWAVFASSHLYLRYLSLRALRFSSFNQKRACILVSHHVSGLPIPGVDDGNLLEPVLGAREEVSPRVLLGCTVSEALAGGSIRLAAALSVYRQENYLLLWHGSTGQVVLKEHCGPQDKLKALWQAAWLQQKGLDTANVTDLRDSLAAAEEHWPGFLHDAEQLGWDVNNVIIRPTSDVYITHNDPSADQR